MNEYSIDRAAEKIYNSKTKEYFQEVISSYSIGNYRSAIVMLYSVIIADLFYKLKEMSERDEDPKAIAILEYIRSQISDGDRRNKSEWEGKVVERVFTETQLLDQSAKVYIDHIKQLRNISAHPVLESEDLLSTPNKDTVRAAIINALDYVLTRPAMYNDRVAIEFMENIPSYSSLIFRSGKYETYLKNKYFLFFTERLVKKVFKFLWIAVYKGQDEQASNFREEYFDTLTIIYKNYRTVLDSYFKEEKEQFNRLILDENDQIKFLIDFFYNAPHLYQYISEDNKVIIAHKIDDKIHLYSRAWFITGNKREHIEKSLIRYISRGRRIGMYQINLLHEMSVEEGIDKEFYYFCIDMFNRGTSYVDCLHRWREMIEPFINVFTYNHILDLLTKMNSNSSIYNANWINNEYLSVIGDYLTQNSIEIENWDEKYINLPKYSEVFVKDDI